MRCMQLQKLYDHDVKTQARWSSHVSVLRRLDPSLLILIIFHKRVKFRWLYARHGPKFYTSTVNIQK
eukprot:m.421675 g.421675  ORF g.421675 m.421675 type:complete len:67 (-) comp34539_c0_seq1:195-395(-)